MTRSKFFVVLAFVFALFATLVGGNVISASWLEWKWLVPAALTSGYLSAIVD